MTAEKYLWCRLGCWSATAADSKPRDDVQNPDAQKHRHIRCTAPWCLSDFIVWDELVYFAS